MLPRSRVTIPLTLIKASRSTHSNAYAASSLNSETQQAALTGCALCSHVDGVIDPHFKASIFGEVSVAEKPG
jgi:hypothetical protein